MTPFQGIIAAISAIALFLHALEGFSRELQAVAGAALQSWLPRVTASRRRGFLIGLIATALPIRASAIGKVAFYFGLIFFALDPVSNELEPMQSAPSFQAALSMPRMPWVGVPIGLAATALIRRAASRQAS